MKLSGKHIEKDRSGYVRVTPDDDEDMWHLYNLIHVGDRVRSSGVRRIQNQSATGSVTSKRIWVTLTLIVTKVLWMPSTASGAADPKAKSNNTGAVVEVAGRVVDESEYVTLGAHHTFALQVHLFVKIEKEAGGWDKIALGRVDESCVPGKGAEVAAIICGEGSAIFCLLSEHMTVVLQRLEVHIPRKLSSQSSAHEKGLGRFYQSLFASFLRHIPFSNPTLRAIVIASPGWVRDSVFDYIMEEASRTSNKELLSARNKFIKVHVNSPHVHSLVEALKSPTIATQLKETKFAREGIMLDKFFKMLATDEMRAWYGPDHVILAADRGAIGTLLISDELFRSDDATVRKRFVKAVESVQGKGGEALIFSSMHESGQQLNQLSGIAAILTYPLDIEVVEAEEKEAREEEERRIAERKAELGED
ncbi:pelota [Epithele typhae]|uniref:pelota n=1 Tax=Epithele typhae TaxID=378194 RepID=UPI002008771F|nr:pelota [Epithele typhae]KAH9943502.1 pelota [Epithele typhae]